MERFLLAAASLSIMLGFGHVIYGELRFLPPYLKSGIVVEVDAKRTAEILRLAWHVWAIAYFAIGGIVLSWAVTEKPDVGAMWSFIALFWGAMLTSLVITKGRHISWVVWLVMGALLFFGL